MNVVFVNTSEKTGGAAIACGRLQKALELKGIHVELVVRDKQTVDDTVVSVNTSWLRLKQNRMRFLWERLVIWINNGFSRKNLFSVSLANSGQDISRLSVIQQADIIHLHWVNAGFLSLRDIRKLLELGKPIVWTLHDMWILTGICHCTGDCDRYKEICRYCPLLRFPFRYDLSNRTWKKKKRLLEKSRISFVTCSRWLLEKSSQSTLLGQQKLISIPNPINTDVFKITDKAEARQKLGLPADKCLLLFGAERADNPMKGITYLIEALRLLAQKMPEACSRVEVVIFGKSKVDLPELPFRSHYVGYIREEERIVAMYNAANVYVTPSLEDNLPNTVMEALACGTPVVGFRTGGIPEMVDHRVNGYMANYKDSMDLMEGIYQTLFEADSAVLSREARQKVLNCYAEDKIAAAYLNLYEQLCRKD